MRLTVLFLLSAFIAGIASAPSTVIEGDIVSGDTSNSNEASGIDIIEVTLPREERSNFQDFMAPYIDGCKDNLNKNYGKPKIGVLNYNKNKIAQLFNYSWPMHDRNIDRNYSYKDFSYSSTAESNTITATAVSDDRKWLVTADAGPDTLIIVWDAKTGVPVRTYYDAHDSAGVCALDMSSDAKFVATLGANFPQSLCVWEWVADAEVPKWTLQMTGNDPQICIKFNPEDSAELLTNGYESVNFYARHTDTLVQTEGLWERTGRYINTRLTTSHFVPASTSAVTATTEGDLILWDNFNISNISVRATDKTHKSAIKFFHHMHKLSINVLEPVAGKYIITGGEEGYVRIYDNAYRVVYSLEKIKAGPIASLSVVPDIGHDSTSQLSLPSLMVVTKTGKVIHITRFTATSQPITLMVLDSHYDTVRAAVVYPKRPLIASVSITGMVQLWNYMDKSLSAKVILNEPLSTCAIDPLGERLAIGTALGNIRMVSAEALTDITVLIEVSKAEIHLLCFSPDGSTIACADVSHAVSLVTFTEGGKWQLIGKFRSHDKPIRSLLFYEGNLLSTSEDRSIIIYDMSKSNAEVGIQVKTISRLEQSAIPKGLVLLPENVVASSSVLVSSNNEYKLKVFNATTQVCRKTVLGPTFGSHIEQLVYLPLSAPALPTQPQQPSELSDKKPPQEHYLLFACADKVVGLMKLPLDGNPYKTVGLIAHPEEVAGITVSPDGKYLFTLGGCDCTFKMWAIDTTVLDAQIELGGNGMEPFLSLLYDGPDYDNVYREMQNIFYYAQLKSQGKEVMTERTLSNEVDVEQVPNILRAFGYYPTEEEVNNIMNEIKISCLLEGADDTHKIDFSTLLKIFINHRPLFPLTHTELSAALQLAAGDSNPIIKDIKMVDNSQDKAGNIDVEPLLRFLQIYGEPLSREQIDAFWGTFGHGRSKRGQINCNEFIRDIVGLEATGHERPSTVGDAGFSDNGDSRNTSASLTTKRVTVGI